SPRGHVGKRLVEERVPVAHADEHWERRAAPRKLPLERACLGERERAERRAAPGHPLIVARHLLETLGRDTSAARDDLEKGPDRDSPAPRRRGRRSPTPCRGPLASPIP